jgi:hypothetical protein
MLHFFSSILNAACSTYFINDGFNAGLVFVFVFDGVNYGSSGFFGTMLECKNKR